MLRVVQRPSPNFNERVGEGVPDILLMHYTGMQSCEAAVQRLTDPAARVSSHYTIDEDGTVYVHVDESLRAWHAGVSHWRGETDINSRSIGIEIVNPGHEFGYRAFPDVQIEAVIELSKGILSRHRIPPRNVIGHSDVAPVRKEDPGELFDWPGLAAAGIGLWPASKPAPLDAEQFFAGLAEYGYDIADRAAVTRAFCRHFRPRNIADAPDAEVMGILAGLLAMVK